MMPEGGVSHIEAHGYSLITTATHEESCKMTSFHQLSVTVNSVMLCGKIIAVISCYESDTVISAGLCATWTPRLEFPVRDYHPTLLNSTNYPLHKEIDVFVWVTWAS